jgi:PAS domain S-box-containing protein
MLQGRMNSRLREWGHRTRIPPQFHVEVVEVAVIVGFGESQKGFKAFKRRSTRISSNAQATYNYAMASAEHSSQQDQARDVRLVVDTIPTLAWSARSDGSADFFNQRWLDYTGLSAEQARDWGWTIALHSDDLNGLVDYWRSVLASGEPGEIEGRLRRFDGVYRWFLFRATPSLDNDGRVVKWFGTNTDIDDRKRAECLLAGENLVLEMTAKGSSLESILEALCRVVEHTGSGCCCSVLVFDPRGSKIQQVVAPSLPSTYNDRFPGTPVDREGGPCTEAARRKTQVIVSDVSSDTQWDRYGWRTAALTHGLKACWSTTILAPNGLVLGTFAIYWREPRTPTEYDQKTIEQITHLAAVAIEHKRNEAALQEREQRLRRIVDTVPGFVCTLSAAGEVELVNRQVLEYFGKTTEELRNWGTSNVVHPEDLPRVIDAWKRSVETGQPYDLELRQRRADGVLGAHQLSDCECSGFAAQRLAEPGVRPQELIHDEIGLLRDRNFALANSFYFLSQYGERLLPVQLWGYPIMNNTYLYIPDEFKDKRVLVTGGTKGAGGAIVRRFALAGASVATAARSPLPKGQKPALFVQVDLSSVEGIARLAGCIMKEWGGIDILVNCVGGSDAPSGGYAALTEEHWQSALNPNSWQPCAAIGTFCRE